MRRLLSPCLCLAFAVTACPGAEQSTPSGSGQSPAEQGPSAAELEAEARALLEQASELEDEGASNPAVMQDNLREAAQLRARANALMLKAKTRALAE